MDSQRRGKRMGESSTPAGSINGSDSTKLEWSPRSQLNGVRPVQYTSPHYLGKFARDPYMGSNKIIDFFSRTTQRVASEKSLRNQATGHVGHCVAEKRGGADNWLLRKPIITPADPFPRNSSNIGLYWPGLSDPVRLQSHKKDTVVHYIPSDLVICHSCVDSRKCTYWQSVQENSVSPPWGANKD